MVAVSLSTLLKFSLATPRVRPLRWARMAVGGGAIQNAD